MLPLDIDGNELRVGDDVEKVGGTSTEFAKMGMIFTIRGIQILPIFNGAFIENGPKPGISLSFHPYRWQNVDVYASDPSCYRLIPRDKKADKNISWKSEVRV